MARDMPLVLIRQTARSRRAAFVNDWDNKCFFNEVKLMHDDVQRIVAFLLVNF